MHITSKESSHFIKLKLDDYVIKAQAGDNSAKEYIAEQYYKVAKSESYKYYKWKNSLDIDDLIQEGALGILRAIEKFDTTKKVPFDYYCKWWINARMHNAIYSRGRTIRTPINKAKKIAKLQKQVAELNANIEDLNVAEISKLTNTNSEDIQKLVCNKVSTFSINQSVSEDSNSELEIFLQSTEISPSDSIIREETLKLIYFFIENKLSEEDQYIIKKYFNIDCENSMTLEEIGIQLNMTKQGIRARKNKILTKIKEFVDNDGQ